MSSSSKTSLGLNMWVGSDKPKREDFCRDNEITDKTIAALQSTKADKTAVSEELSHKAPLASPNFAGTPTANSKEIPTTESGICELSLSGTDTSGAFVYTSRVGNYTRIGNLIDLHGHIFVNRIDVIPTGEVLITGLPGVPQSDGLISINYLDGGINQSFRKCMFGCIAAGRIYLKTDFQPEGLCVCRWGTTVNVAVGDNQLMINFAVRYFTD